MQIVVNEQLKDAIEWTCKYANEYKVDIDIHIDADGEISVSVCPTYRDIADTPQTESQNSNKNSNVISVYDGVSEAVRCAMCSNPNKSDRGCDGACSYDEKLYERIMKAIAESVADTPQTDCLVKTSQKSRDSHEVDTSQTDCETCKYDKEEWYSDACDSCCKAHSNYEPQPDCPYREYPCDMCDEQTDCQWK